MKIEGTIKAWLPDHGSVEKLLAGGDSALDELAYAASDMSTQGWAPVGVAKVAVDVPGRDDLIARSVVALRREIGAVRTEAEEKCARIEDRIQRLLALPAPESAEAPE